MKKYIILASAILLVGCSKHIDVTKLNGDWSCTELSDGKIGDVWPMRFHNGEFGWTLPTKSPTISVLVRAHYTIDGTNISMPELYTQNVGMPFNDNPGWSKSERSIVTGIEELTETKLILAPWKTTSSKRKLNDSNMRYECVRPGGVPQADEKIKSKSVSTSNANIPHPVESPLNNAAVAPQQASALPSQRSQPLSSDSPAIDPLTIVVRLQLPSNSREHTLVGVTVQPRTPESHVQLNQSIEKIKQISRTVLGRALRTPGTVLIDNRLLANELLTELRQQLGSDFIETVSLDDVGAGVD